MTLETSRRGSVVVLAACATVGLSWLSVRGPVRSAPRGDRLAAHVATNVAPPRAVEIRFGVEAAWMLDPQLCLDAFVWFHSAGLSLAENLGVVRCWR